MPDKTNNEDSAVKRLPCRGCTSDCSNYETCEGKPWRFEPNREGDKKAVLK